MSRLPGSMPRNNSKTSNKDKLSPPQSRKLKRADRLIQRGHYQQAERLIDDVQGRLRAPYPLVLMQVQGTLAFARQRYTEARKIYKAVWERDKRNPVALFYLGKIYRKLKQPEAGRGLLETGVMLNRGNRPLQTELVKTLLDLSELDKAEQYVEQLHQQDPTDPQAWQLTGEVKRRRCLLPEAVDDYRQGLEQLIKLPPPPDKSAADAEDTFDVERHEDTLWELLAQLKAAGVQAFAAFGTLLGLTRDGQLIGFDKDVDVCIPFNQMKQAIACMEENGWKETNHSFGMINPRAFGHPKKGLSVDLFALMYDRTEQALVTGLMLPGIPWEWNFLMKFPPMSLKESSSPHGPVWELTNPEAFIEAEYGPGWREPDPYFATFGGEHNLVRFSYLTQCYAYIRCFSYWNKGSFKKLDALLYNMLRHKPGDELLETMQRLVKDHLAREIERQQDEDLLDEKDDATVH